MAFSFGSTTPSFGAVSTPGFGAASTPAFGAASTPAFGAASTPSLFGSTPAPAFGAAPTATATPSFGFGQTAAAASSSAFSFSTSTPAATGFGFGASAPAAVTASAPAFGTASPAPSLFSPSPFGTPGAAAPSPIGTNLFQPGAQQQQQQLQQPGLITYSTRYDDLPADRQKELQDIQREIGNYREDCEKLDRDQRLHDSLSMKKNMEDEAAALKQNLQGMLNSIRADDDALADFREKVLKLLRSTEYAVRTFQRAKLWREAPQQYKGQIIPTQVQELLASPVLLPSPYLEQAIQGFQQTLDNYRQVINELEQALPSDIMASFGATDEASIAQALPLVISHMHDYFVHVAARMERLHQEVSRSKDAFIGQRRAEGDYSDPFEESRRYLASTPRADGRGTPSANGHASPQLHYHLPSTPMHGTPFPASTPAAVFPAAAAPTPFGTPFGGAISPAAGDMSRKDAGGSSRRRR